MGYSSIDGDGGVGSRSGSAWGSIGGGGSNEDNGRSGGADSERG